MNFRLSRITKWNRIKVFDIRKLREEDIAVCVVPIIVSKRAPNSLVSYL